MLTLAVAVAAGLGAVARYLTDLVVQHRTRSPYPLGTLVVNVSGSLVLGLIVGMSLHHGLAGRATAVLGAGFTGGFTTFSTWMWETVALRETGELATAAGNILGSLAIGILAAAAGLGLALLGT